MKVLAALLAFVLPLTTAGGFRNARLPWSFAFPRDDGAHPAFQSEWWYFTGHLRAANGRRFGYELTFFRYGLAPGDPTPRPGESRWRGNEVFPAHFAITDIDGARFAYDTRFVREALGMGAAGVGRAAVHSRDWTLREPARGTFVLHAVSPAVGALDLRLRAEKPPAIQGAHGVSIKGSCATCASHYVSLTRLATRGTLVVDGARLAVGGLTWMDHEFGSDELARGVVGWDWFSVQLDDREEIMDYRLRRADGTPIPQSSGTLDDRRGRVVLLPLAAIDVVATGTWRSPHDGATYPSGWRLRIPRRGIDLTLTPVLADQELAATDGTFSYWEGDVDVRDASGRRVGAGYVELTGYAGTLSL